MEHNMKNKLACLILSFSTLFLSACQNTPSKDHIALNKNKIDLATMKKGQEEDFYKNLPKDQWLYLYFQKDQHHFAYISNYTSKRWQISMALNCKDPNKKPYYLIEDQDGADELKAYEEYYSRVEFFLDDKSFADPFHDYQPAQFENFKNAMYKAHVLKIVNYMNELNPKTGREEETVRREFIFQNQPAELLKLPSDYCKSDQEEDDTESESAVDAT